MVPSYLSSRWQERGFTKEQAHAYYNGTGTERPAFPRAPQASWDVRSPYQRIRLFEGEGMAAVYLNDTIQMEGQEDHYHNEIMVGIPLSVVRDPRRVLLLGGGFGMSARLALRFAAVEAVQVVEVDAEVVRFSQTSRAMRKLNGKSLFDPRVCVHIGDAFDFPGGDFDLIVFDCDITATRQRVGLDADFLVDFLVRLQSRLRPGGAFSTRIPIDDNYLEVAKQRGGDEDGDLHTTAALVRQVWPHCRMLEFLSLFCGRELYVWNFSEEPVLERRRLPGASPTYQRVLDDLTKTSDWPPR